MFFRSLTQYGLIFQAKHCVCHLRKLQMIFAHAVFLHKFVVKDFSFSRLIECFTWTGVVRLKKGFCKLRLLCFLLVFFPLVSLKGPVLKCCLTRKWISDVWQGYNAWMGKRPLLLQAISLMPAVWCLRWKRLGSERCAQKPTSAKRSSWHEWGGPQHCVAVQSACFFTATNYQFVR